MKNKYLIGQYCIDYIPLKLLDKITVKDIYEWRDFLFIHNVDNIKDIYIYLDGKFKNYETKEM